MNRNEKGQEIEVLKEKFANNEFFYLTDSSSMTVGQINDLRRACFEKNIQMQVVKNTLAIKALESAGEEKNYSGLYESLKGPTTILFSETANLPAKVIKDYRKKGERPILKAAYIGTSIYVGDDQLDTLSSLKSREELIGEVISLLQSPMKNVLGALNSGGQKLSGLVKALEERA